MITIVTDSSSYFRKDEAETLGIKIIPINYTVGKQAYSETYSDQNGEFEALLKSGASAATSHSNLAAFLSAFEEELHLSNDVLCITISSRLSGAYGTAYTAAKQIESKNIFVFDSQFTAGGLYLLVKEAKKMIDSGMDLNEVMEKLPSVRDKISIVFSVGDMTQLRKSGRLGFVRMSVSTFLNIKPILLCKDGAVVSEGIARGNTEVIKKLTEKISDNTKEAVINYIGDNTLATNIYHIISKNNPTIKLTLQKIGPVLGIHLGLKVIAVSFIERE